MSKYNEIPIRNIEVANKLITYGEHIIRIDRDKHNHSKLIFIFLGTDRFFKNWNKIKVMMNIE